MYGRVANPRVCGRSTHLKNIPTSSSGVGTGGGTLFFLSMSAMRFRGLPIRFQCGVDSFDFFVSSRIGVG